MLGINGINNRLVATAAGSLGHFPVIWLNPQWIGKITSGKGYRMPETVLSLCPVLGKRGMRRMAIIAGRNRTVARFRPSIEMLLHDVAVGTCRRVVGKVGPSLGIDECVGNDSNHQPTNSSHNHPSKLHSTESHDEFYEVD